ncbi:hypothetical protein MRB53_000711 [Persea americana]|uniref:Uncharacterized protein n=1 Tax=Persea americana TaxID=3435 RepID=A0ACC2MQB1_PERAE|nr:hypothetical protein MRB53_000711 [Persea americana]
MNAVQLSSPARWNPGTSVSGFCFRFPEPLFQAMIPSALERSGSNLRRLSGGDGSVEDQIFSSAMDESGSSANSELNTTVLLQSSSPVRSRTTTRSGCQRGHLLLRLGFAVSAFPAVVFSDDAEALPTRVDDDGKESFRRHAAWHDGSAKPAAIPFSSSSNDGHNSSAPLIGIVTEPSYLFEIRFENSKSIPASTYLFLLHKPETKREKRTQGLVARADRRRPTRRSLSETEKIPEIRLYQQSLERSSDAASCCSTCRTESKKRQQVPGYVGLISGHLRRN